MNLHLKDPLEDSIRSRSDQIAYDFIFPYSRTLLTTRYVCSSGDGRDRCLRRRLTVTDSGGRLIDMQKSHRIHRLRGKYPAKTNFRNGHGAIGEAIKHASTTLPALS